MCACGVARSGTRCSSGPQWAGVVWSGARPLGHIRVGKRRMVAQVAIGSNTRACLLRQRQVIRWAREPRRRVRRGGGEAIRARPCRSACGACFVVCSFRVQEGASDCHFRGVHLSHCLEGFLMENWLCSRYDAQRLAISTVRDDAVHQTVCNAGKEGFGLPTAC